MQSERRELASDPAIDVSDLREGEEKPPRGVRAMAVASWLGFTLGMDGFFYISVGDRGVYQAKSAKDGSTLTMQGGGIIRCRPDGSEP